MKTMPLLRSMTLTSLIALPGLTVAQQGQGQIVRPMGSDDWYYRMGGGESFLAYRQSNRTTVDLGVGADWRMFRGCEFDPRISVKETFSDAQQSIYGLADDLVASAEGLLLTFGLSKIQEMYPTMYDFVMNGAKDAMQKYQFSLKSCRDYQSDLNAGRDPSAGWAAFGKSSSWADSASTGENPVEVDQNIDRDSANKGINWIGGERRGGREQEPVQVVGDTTRAGYQHITAGEGSVATGGVDLGAGLDNETMVFESAEDAQVWMVEVVGERKISTCIDCDKLDVTVGQGLRLKLIEEKAEVVELMAEVLATDNPTLEQLDALSVPSMGLIVTDQMIRKLRNLATYEVEIYANKLSSEIAVMRVMEQALTARDILKAGMQEPNVAANSQAMAELAAAKERLDDEIQNILFESDIRQKIFSGTAISLNQMAERTVNDPAVKGVGTSTPKLGRLKAGAISDGE